ncbi:hypothetical protein M0R45_026777 [Rubus argutus]|uniref:Uncharacterized protein n=1 Tax=Rubus argutus TaxID=59490 RepID=A0AAW1WZT1_RUBAR
MPKPVHSKYPTIKTHKPNQPLASSLWSEFPSPRGSSMKPKSADEPRSTPRHRFPHRRREPKPARILSAVIRALPLDAAPSIAYHLEASHRRCTKAGPSSPSPAATPYFSLPWNLS